MTFRVAITGASSLLGKDLKEALERRNFPARDFVLLDESDQAGTLTEAGGEITFVRPLDEESFEGAQAAFFAGSAKDALQNWRQAQRAGCAVIDLSGGLAEIPQAKCSIPSLKRASSSAAQGAESNGEANVFCAPGPAALISCTLAAGLERFSPARLALVFFHPVSEHGQAGVDELEAQTTNLLSFRPFEQPVFDAQVAFNLLNKHGAAARASLEEVRRRAAVETKRYLGGQAAVPAVQIVQAPVFYGYSFAAYAEFAAAPRLEEIEAGLKQAGVRIAGADDPSPSNVSVAGEGEIHVGRVRSDEGIAGGVWLWGSADNLRLVTVNAVRIAEEFLGAKN